MKRLHPLVFAISAGLAAIFLSQASFSAEKKPSSYKDRVAGEAAYDLDETASKTNKTTESLVAKYPLATRAEPDQKGNPAVAKKRNQMIAALQKNNDLEAKKFADELKDDSGSNANDKVIALRVLHMLVSKKDINNHLEAIPLLEEIIKNNMLDNNTHYALMSELAQRYLANQDYQDAFETADKFLIETKAENKVILAIKGNALFRLKREKEAIPVLEKAHSLDMNDVAITEMLARSYSNAGQPGKAAELTKMIAQTSSGDRVAQVNLAITYRDAKQYEQAADVIADLRKNQQLVEERDYLTAMNIYSAMKNKEDDMVAVVQEGLDKGVLKPSASNYNVLAESYYYSNRDDGTAKAMQNWAKAAPLSKDGAVYLNLAIVQCQQEMWAACKESAKNAIAKGGINASDARSQIANADKGLGKSK
jgi:predicted Zn-dependent protease